MEGESRSAPRRGPHLLLILLVLACGAVGLILYLRLEAIGDRIGVIIAAEEGTIRIAGADMPPGPVQWICDASDPRLVRFDESPGSQDRWDDVVAQLLGGAKVVAVERQTRTQQSRAVDGKAVRQVVALRAILTIEHPDGRRETALGIGAGIGLGEHAVESTYLTVVQLVGAGGAVLPVDGDPLFNDRPVPWLDRLRGSPAHIVRFGLVARPLENAKEEEDGMRTLDDDAAKRAIEERRRAIPERPSPPGGG